MVYLFFLTFFLIGFIAGALSIHDLIKRYRKELGLPEDYFSMDEALRERARIIKSVNKEILGHWEDEDTQYILDLINNIK